MTFLALKELDELIDSNSLLSGFNVSFALEFYFFKAIASFMLSPIFEKIADVFFSISLSYLVNLPAVLSGIFLSLVLKVELLEDDF